MVSDDGPALMTNPMKTENVTSRTASMWGLVAFALSLPVDIAVSHFVDPGRGRAAGIALGLTILSIRVFWYLRKQVWFWITIAALTIFHVVLIFVVPWTMRSFPSPALWPVGIADFAAVCGCVKLCEKLMSRSGGADSPA